MGSESLTERRGNGEGGGNSEGTNLYWKDQEHEIGGGSEPGS